MSRSITITQNDISQYIKCSYKLPEFSKEIAKRKIIAEKAVDLGVEVSNEELQKTADLVRVINNVTQAHDTWQWLKSHGMSLDDFEEVVFATLISGKLAKCLFEDKAEKVFVESKLSYTHAVFYEIIFDNKALAMEYFYSIQEKEVSFFEVAYQNIKNEELRRMCGFKGLLTRKQLKPEISSLIFASSPPCLLQPVTTNQGVHLMFVENIIEPVFDDKAKAMIIAELFDRWLDDEFEQISLIQA
jgi:hypothetical protein